MEELTIDKRADIKRNECSRWNVSNYNRRVIENSADWKLVFETYFLIFAKGCVIPKNQAIKVKFKFLPASDNKKA